MVWAFAIQGQKLPFAVGLPDPNGICQIEGMYCSALFIHVLDPVFNGADPMVSCSRFAPVAIRAALTMHGPNGWFSRGSFGTLHSFYRTPSYFHCSLLLV